MAPRALVAGKFFNAQYRKLSAPVDSNSELFVSGGDLDVLGMCHFSSSQVHNLYDNDVTYHPSTQSLVEGRTPWVMPTISRDAPSDEYVEVAFRVEPDADWDELEEHMSGTEPFYITRYVFCPDDTPMPTVKAYVDGSTYWAKTEWTSVETPYVPKWKRVYMTPLVGGSSLTCTSSRRGGHRYRRKIIAATAGQDVVASREGEACFIISCHSSFSVAENTFDEQHLVTLVSDAVTLTPTEDTIFVKIYR